MSVIEYKPKARRKKTKLSLNIEAEKTIRALIITLTSMIVVLAITFLGLTNQSSQKGYALQQAKIRNEALKSENASINTKLSHYTSFQQLQEEGDVDSMTEPESKQFVTDEDNRVK